MNQLVIRRLTQPDTTDFFNLRLESLQENPSSFLSSYEEEKQTGSIAFEKLLTSNDTKNVVLGAFLNNKLIGIIGVYQESAKKAAHKCQIWGFYVQSTYQRKGAGKKLLDAAITYARETLECLTVNLSVEASNIAAKKLYESYGFITWGVEPKTMRVEQKFYDEFHMSLML